MDIDTFSLILSQSLQNLTLTKPRTRTKYKWRVYLFGSVDSLHEYID
jgi:hypothetical protein